MKLTALAALGLLALTPAAAHAEDTVAPAAEAAVATEMKAEVAPAVEMKEVTLKDGTKVSIEGENVFVVGADGAKTPAPDGEHELADGSKVKTAGGKLVVEPVAPVEAPAEAPKH